MSFKHDPIPAAAKAAGMTKLVFAEDFETEKAIDFSGEGKEGYSFYADRPYRMPTHKPEECVMKDSVLYLKPEVCSSSIGPVSYSKAGRTGFLWHYGYAEAKIRADLPTDEFNGWPAFWSMDKRDMMGEFWVNCGEIDILEMVDPGLKGRSGGVRKDMIYTGTLHEHLRTFDEEGNELRKERKFASSLVCSSGYNDQFDYIDDQWHTYAVLWEPGHIAWYMDNKLMHSARYNDKDLPEYYYRDDPTPLPRLEESRPELANRTWPGAHHVMETSEQILCLGAHKNWPMEVDWVRVWQK